MGEGGRGGGEIQKRRKLEGRSEGRGEGRKADAPKDDAEFAFKLNISPLQCVRYFRTRRHSVPGRMWSKNSKLFFIFTFVFLIVFV